MGFSEVLVLDCDKAVGLGGRDKKTGKPNPKTATGHFVGSKDIASKYSKTGFAKLHILSTPEGTLGVYGKTDLDQKMAAVTPGALVRITQTHSVPTTKGNDLFKFKVEVDMDNMIDVGNFSQSSAAASDSSDDGDTGYEGGSGDDEYSEPEVDAEESQPDEVPPVRATAPRQAATPPSAASQARVREMINKARTSRSA